MPAKAEYNRKSGKSRSAIRIMLRFMIMSRCHAIHPVRNIAFGEQALRGCIPDWMRTARSNAQTSIYNKQTISVKESEESEMKKCTLIK